MLWSLGTKGAFCLWCCHCLKRGTGSPKASHSYLSASLFQALVQVQAFCLNPFLEPIYLGCICCCHFVRVGSLCVNTLLKVTWLVLRKWKFQPPLTLVPLSPTHITSGHASESQWFCRRGNGAMKPPPQGGKKVEKWVLEDSVIFVFFNLCVSVCACVYMCAIYEHMCVQVCLRVCAYEESRFRCVESSFITLHLTCWRQGLSKPEAHYFGWMV